MCKLVSITTAQLPDKCCHCPKAEFKIQESTTTINGSYGLSLYNNKIVLTCKNEDLCRYLEGELMRQHQRPQVGKGCPFDEDIYAKIDMHQ